MKKCLVYIAAVVCFIVTGGVGTAHALSFLDNRLTISGFLKNETAHNIGHDKDFMKIENTFQIETEYRFNEAFNFFFIIREFYDSAFDANPIFENNRHLLCRTHGTDWLRELYLDYNSSSLDIRFGKQQVVWGTADGIKIMDVICPTDQREYFLDNFADSRIPRWMLKLEYSPTVNGTLQFLFIPDFETDFLAPPGSPFTYRANTLKGELAEALQSLSRIPRTHYTFTEVYDKPGESFENASFGVRWLDILSNGLEYTLNYLHGYGNPGGRVLIYNMGRPPFPGAPPQGDWVMKFKYHFTELMGFTFTKGITTGPLQGLSVRGEFAYIHNNYNSTDTPNQLGGIARVDNYKYVLGLDKYLVTNWLFSFQFIQLVTDRETDNGNRLLFGPTKAPLDKFETFLTLRVSTDFMHERIKPDCLIMYGDDNDWRVSPRIEYELRDYLNIALGTHFFWGKRDQLLGEFRDNDEAFIEIKYGF
ncbi:MAG: DUF1302 family protein [Pseudomonadota bacterium]